MLGLYFYTHVIGQKSCNMLSILNKITLHKELPNCLTNNIFGQKKPKTQQQNKKSNIKRSPEPEIEPGTFSTHSGCITTAPPSQLRGANAVNLFNCFDAMGKQS